MGEEPPSRTVIAAAFLDLRLFFPERWRTETIERGVELLLKRLGQDSALEAACLRSGYRVDYARDKIVGPFKASGFEDRTLGLRVIEILKNWAQLLDNEP